MVKTFAERGIEAQAVANGWEFTTHYNRPAYRFPVNNSAGQTIGYRFKFMDGQTPKNLWEGKQPDKARYYLPVGSVDKIKRYGSVYVTEGEPDALTMHAMGYTNTICWFNGAQGAPDTFFADMGLLGVKEVFYIPDLDYAGLGAALKLYEAAQAQSAIELHILRLPGDIGTDLNDVYIEQGFQLTPEFDEWKHADLVQMVEMLTPLRKGQTKQVDDKAINPAVAEAIVSHALSIGTQHTDDDIVKIISPASHDKDKPGSHARFYKSNLTAYDFAHGRWFGTQELVELWGIDVEALGGWFDPNYSEPVKPRPSANGHSKPVAAEPTIPPDFFVSGEDALEQAKQALLGKTKGIVIRNPIPAIHKFQGYAKNLQGGMVMVLSGVSGGGKTISVETMTEYLLTQGHNVMLWGGEWNPVQMAQRRIQRYKGATLNQMLDDAIDKDLDTQTRQNSLEIANNLQYGDYGHIDYINSKYSHYTLRDTLSNMGKLIEARRTRGRQTHVVILDYIQLVTLGDDINSKNMAETAFEQFKQFVIQYGVVGIMTSQVNKTAEDKAKNGGTLSAGDSQYIRLDKANLQIMLSPVYAGFQQKEIQPFVRLSIMKNSIGECGYVYLDRAPMANLELPLAKALDTDAVEARLKYLNEETGPKEFAIS